MNENTYFKFLNFFSKITKNQIDSDLNRLK